MESIAQKVDTMTDTLGIQVDISDCGNCGYRELSKKLSIMQKCIAVKESIKLLDESVKDFKAICSPPVQQLHLDDEEDDQTEAFRRCHSIRDLERSGEFEYKVEKEALMCTVCGQKAASYGEELEDDFTEKVQSVQFRSLKRSLRRHKDTRSHQKKIKDNKKLEVIEEKVLCRESRIGQALGHVAYYLLKLGRPNKDYVYLVDVLAKAGVDVGQLNHSEKFVAKWGPVCAEVIDRKLVRFFTTVLPQTGHRPHAKAICDKATWKHETRMMSGLVSAVPDSDQLLQAFFTGSKVCPGGTGDQQTESLVEVYDSYISGNQYLGLAADGATLHCNVGRKLSEHFGREGHDDYDPLHKAGLVDVHMRAEPGTKFKFLQEITDAISSVYNMVNMGQEFHHFFTVAKAIAEQGQTGIQFKLPRFFSDTRFANYSHLVFDGFIENWPALIRTLTEVQEAGIGPGATARQALKADKCAGLQALIHCLTFVFLLCGTTDLYSKYSSSVNVLQIVNILPHEKADMFELGCRNKIEEMKNSVNPVDCPCSIFYKYPESENVELQEMCEAENQDTEGEDQEDMGEVDQDQQEKMASEVTLGIFTLPFSQLIKKNTGFKSV